ncbi:hypothetical protein [Pseudogemmobacter sonorensis]|uniref:hypothetical protein n=1 Tax=Pseudogemmobacter sonorensis TaxID=2989681 RepID=UPI0036A42C71
MVTVSFENYDANGNNTGNDSAAIAAALSSGLAVRNPPESVYRITTTVNVLTSKSIDWEGGITAFAGGLGQGAIDIAMATDSSGKQSNLRQTVFIDKCSILAVNATNGFGLRIRPRVRTY